MKNETETNPTAKIQPAPAVSAVGLTVNYAVIVSLDQGENAFTVKGSFDLPSAMHPAMRFQAEEDFEIFLNRCIGNTAKIMLGQFMRKVTDEEFKKLEAPESTSDQKNPTPSSRPVLTDEFLQGLSKKSCKAPSDAFFGDSPLNFSAEVAAA